jgi:TRAP-type transport system periplasmic protein
LRAFDGCIVAAGIIGPFLVARCTCMAPRVLATQIVRTPLRWFQGPAALNLPFSAGRQTMRRFLFKSLVPTAVLVTLGLAGAAAAQVQERSFKLSLQSPKGHPLEQGATQFAALVAAASGGKLKVNVFAGGALGGDAQAVAALQSGTVEIAVLNSSVLASQVKDFEVYDFPFLFASTQEADTVLDGPFGLKMHAKLPDKGLLGLAYWELGFRHITNSRRALHTVEDIAGLKLRVIPRAINIDWVKAVGADPRPMASTEVYAGLENKAIDGQENPFAAILANKFFQVQEHLAVSKHQYSPQSLIFSKKVWEGLSAEEKKIVQIAAVEAGRFQRRVNRELASNQLDQLTKAGMQVTEFSATEQQKLRDKLKPVIDKHGAALAATVAELQAELAQLRR